MTTPAVHPPLDTSRILCAPRYTTGHIKRPTHGAHAVHRSQGRGPTIEMGTLVTAQPDFVRDMHSGPRVRHYYLYRPTSEHIGSSVTSRNGSAELPLVLTLATPR